MVATLAPAATQIVEHARALLKADYAAIVTVHPGDGSLMWRAVLGSANTCNYETMGQSVEVVDRVLVSGQPVLLDYTASLNADANALHLYVAEELHTSLSLPLLGDGGPFGALVIGWRTPVQVGANSVQLAEALAGSAAVGLSNVGLYEAERAARAQAEAAQWRLAFVEEAGTILAGSLDYEVTLATVAQLAVPQLADWCIVHMMRPDGSVSWLTAAHGDPEKEAVARELQRRYPRDPNASGGLPLVLREGRSALYPEVSDDELVRRATDEEHLRLLRLMASKSSMIVPLLARGRILGAMSFLSTRPDRRYTQDDLALAEEVARRAALAVENAWLYYEATAALRLQDEFLAVVSHDLRAPLGKVKGFAELLRDHVAEVGDPDPEMLRWLSRIDAAASQMVFMVDELLDLALIKTDRPMTLHRRSLDLVALVARQVDEYQQIADHHRLVFDPRVEHLLGEWDGPRIGRVLANLLSNAIKYSPDGGEIVVTVGPHEADGRVYAMVRVRDSGVGIPAADLAHIFQRFHRAGNVVGKIAGTGIGLAGARQIVQQHEGSISVESSEGSGAAFTMLLPLPASHAVPIAQDHAESLSAQRAAVAATTGSA